MGATLTPEDHARLFDDFVRTDVSPCGHTEREFAFLNRTSAHPFRCVRDEIERWFAEIPAPSCAGLAARARGDDQEWASVFWELYLHNLLRRAGFSVEIEPQLPGVTTKVDFLARRGQCSIAIEATTVLGPSAEKAAHQRKLTVYDSLRRLNSPNFWLEVDIFEEGPSDLAVGRHRADVESWLASLDPNALEDRLAQEGDESLPTHAIRSAGWHVELAAWPRAVGDRGKAYNPLGAFGPGQASLIDDITPLRKRLRAKGSHYGDLDVPLVIAVLMLRDFADERDVMSALFGTAAIQYTQRLRKEDPPPWARRIRRDDGYFLRSTGPIHPGVSALLVAERLRPWNIADVSPVVWHHPAPRRPLASVLPLPSVAVELPTGSLRREPAEVPVHEVLGIRRDWPGFPARRERTG